MSRACWRLSPRVQQLRLFQTVDDEKLCPLVWKEVSPLTTLFSHKIRLGNFVSIFHHLEIPRRNSVYRVTAWPFSRSTKKCLPFFFKVIPINNLFLIRRKLTSEYDQLRLTTIITCNNYNKVYLGIPKIYNLKLINLTITGKSLPK